MPSKPDNNERIDIKYKIASGEWKCCSKCDWFYKFTVLPNCPMCGWSSKKEFYQDLPYEGPGFE
jgi:anaerobic ribonucleoside-triphosphate reductase